MRFEAYPMTCNRTYNRREFYLTEDRLLIIKNDLVIYSLPYSEYLDKELRLIREMYDANDLNRTLAVLSLADYLLERAV